MKTYLSRLGIFSELLVFFWRQKLWWLIPLVVIIVLFGVLFIFASASGIAPFIYPFF